MSLGVWQSTIVSESTGLPVPGASVTVTIADTSTLAILFSDRDGLNPISNPLPSNTHGFVRLYCTPGRYDIVATYGVDQSEAWMDTIILEDSSGGTSNLKSVTAVGDATGVTAGSPDSTLPLVLATVNPNPGTHGFAGQTPIITLNEKGLATAATQVLTETAWGNLTGSIDSQIDLRDLFISAGKSFGATGVTSYGDTVNLVALDDATLRILPLQQGLFYNEIATTGLRASYKSFPQKDVALSAAALVADGLYIRYVSYDKLGNVSFSANSTANDYNYIMLGVVFLKRVAGVTTFTNGAAGPRNVLTYPDISGNNQFVKTFLKFNSNVGILPNTNLTIRNLSGFIKGESIAWHTATPNEKPVASGNPTSFITLNPGTAALAAFPAAGTAVQTTQYWNGSAMVSTGGANTASVQRFIITSTGGFVLQVGEATYASLTVAADSMATAPFTDIFPGLDLFVEIARFAVRNGAANLNLTSDAVFKQAGGLGGSGGVSLGGTVTSVGVTGNDGIVVANSPITSSGTITLDLGNITPDSLSTNLITLSGVNPKITGNFSSANRPYVETSTVNQNTYFGLKPNGTGQISDFVVENSSDPANAAHARFYATSTFTGIASDFTGSKAYLPFIITTGGADTISFATNGDVTVNRGILSGNGSGLTNLKPGTTSQVGVVQLTDSVTSTSTTTAATPNSVKTAYDLAASRMPLTPVTIEIGRQDGVASTPFVDFHSSVAVADYNARIAVAGGDATSGSGSLNFYATVFNFSGGGLVGNGSGLSGLNASNLTTGNVPEARLPFQPIQQGGGVGQGVNKINIGWGAGSKLKLSVDTLDQGNIAIESWVGANYAPINSPTFTGIPIISATSATEGGEIHLAKGTGSSLAGDVCIDVLNSIVRIFEGGGTGRGVALDISTLAAGVGSTFVLGTKSQAATANTIVERDGSGGINCVTWTATSDITLKENIKELSLETCKEILAKVQWHSFDMIDGQKNLNGVIAQELIDIYPDAVVKNADETYGVNYTLLYNLQMRVNQDLEQRLARLEAILLEK